jgi:hypothetical protein
LGANSARLIRDFHSELFDEERPAVGGFFNDFGGRFAGAVSGFSEKRPSLASRLLLGTPQS